MFTSHAYGCAVSILLFSSGHLSEFHGFGSAGCGGARGHGGFGGPDGFTDGGGGWFSSGVPGGYCQKYVCVVCVVWMHRMVCEGGCADTNVGAYAEWRVCVGERVLGMGEGGLVCSRVYWIILCIACSPYL